MKLSLPIKLAIFVLVLFALVIATCLLWTPVHIRYYNAKYYSENVEACAVGIKGFLRIGGKGRSTLESLLKETLQRAPDNREVLIVDAILSIGETGKKLLAAQLHGGKEAAEFLARYWKNYNETDKTHVTTCDSSPLYIAASKGYRDATRLLVAKGADLNAKVRNGATPLHYWALIEESEHNNPPPFSDYVNVFDNGSINRICAYEAAVQIDIEFISFLLDKGADVNAKDNRDRTPLHWAASNGCSDTIALLIEKGADVNTKTIDDWTPLHLAVINHAYRTAVRLTERGADINAKNNDGKTPLDLAIDKDYEEISNLLRSHGGKTGEELKAEQDKK